MDDKSNYIFLGFIIGFILACFMFWYGTGDKPTCDYAPVTPIEENCTPDYLGSCT